MFSSWCYFTGICLTLPSLVTDRRGGFWNRTVLAGVSLAEIFVSIFLTYIGILVVIFSFSLICLWKAYDTVTLTCCLTYFSLITAHGICAIFFGIFLSTFCSSHVAASLMLVIVTLVLNSFSGVIVPIERNREIFKIVSKILPLTYPSIAVRDIMIKKFGFGDVSVQLGFLSAIFWNIFIILAAILVLRRRKFSQNT